MGSGELTADAKAYYETTGYVFERFLRAIAPIVPFHSEYLYRKLTGAESVHLQSWPQIDENLIHLELEHHTSVARQICEIGHQIRKTNAWKVRKPLAKLEITIDADCSKIKDNTWQTVLDELNIKNIVVNGGVRYPNPEVVVSEEELQHEGAVRDLIRTIQGMRKEKNIGVNELVKIQVPKEFAADIEYIKKRVRAASVNVGETLLFV